MKSQSKIHKLLLMTNLGLTNKQKPIKGGEEKEESRDNDLYLL